LDNLAPPTPFDTTLIGFAISLALLLAFYLPRGGSEGRGWVFQIALLAFLLKAILVPIYFEWLVWLGNFGFAYVDARGHHEQGIDIAAEWEYNVPHTTWGWYARDPGFYRLTAWVYLWIGPNTLIIRFFLVACISMSLLYVHRITRLYTDEPTARVATLLQAFLPFPILTSLNHRKDPLVQLIILFLFYHAIRVFRQEPGWTRSMAYTVLGLVAIYPFRSGFILPFLGVMVICFVLANRNVIQGAALTTITLIGLVVIQVAAPDDSKINIDTYSNRVEATLEGSAEHAEVGGGVTSILRVTSLFDSYKIPFAAAAYLILPYPPELSGYPVSRLATTLNLLSVLLLPHMLIGVWALIRAPDWRIKLPLVVFPMVFLLVLGAVHVGVVRYKLIFYPVCLIWAAVGWRIGTSLFLKLAIYGGLFVLTVPVYLNRFGLL